MKTMQNIRYGSFPEEELDLYLPEGGAHTLFLYFHGGGLEGGSKEGLGRMAERFTEAGIALASANYRMYPTAQFPDYLEDSADAAHWAETEGKKLSGAARLFIGGSSAGGYISMMLFADARFLEKRGMDAMAVDGYVFDAGQPTTHFNILKYDRGADPRLVRLDEAAPLYFIDHDYPKDASLPRLQIFCAERDMVNRLEQNRLLMRTLLHFGYPEENLRFDYMEGFGHCGYTGNDDFCTRVIGFIG